MAAVMQSNDAQLALPRFCTVEQLAAEFGFSAHWIYKLNKRGKGPPRLPNVRPYRYDTHSRAFQSNRREKAMLMTEEKEKILSDMTRAEKAELLQWIVRDLGDAFPGIESRGGRCLGSIAWTSNDYTGSTQTMPGSLSVRKTLTGLGRRVRRNRARRSNRGRIRYSLRWLSSLKAHSLEEEPLMGYSQSGNR